MSNAKTFLSVVPYLNLSVNERVAGVPKPTPRDTLETNADFLCTWPSQGRRTRDV
jgi:hypothetical protein